MTNYAQNESYQTPAVRHKEAKEASQAEIRKHHLTVNPGDRIDDSASIAEKAHQVAVDAPDITGDHIVVPAFFIVRHSDGTQKALHHVRDADQISDVIRQMRMDQNGNRIWW